MRFSSRHNRRDLIVWSEEWHGIPFEMRHLWNMGLMWVSSRVLNHWLFTPSSTHVFMEGWCTLSPWKHGAIFMNWTVTEWQSVVYKLRFVGIICGSEIRNLTQDSCSFKRKRKKDAKGKVESVPILEVSHNNVCSQLFRWMWSLPVRD